MIIDKMLKSAFRVKKGAVVKVESLCQLMALSFKR